jgi:flagellar biosynthesis protein FlhF
MNLIPFTACSAVEAAQQIRERLGPNAVVVHVRPLQAEGLARLWRSPRFEVLAYRPEEGGDKPHPDLKLAAADGLLPIAPRPTSAGTARTVSEPGLGIDPGVETDGKGWAVGRVLEGAGLLAVNAQRVVDQLRRFHGPDGAPSLPDQLGQARQALAELWRRPPGAVEASLRPHVFVGPPGVGKTTCLCKWLTQLVLLEGRPARVWRLDGATANTAEPLEVYCEALGVPVERCWRVTPEPGVEVAFVDLPGVDWRDADALREMAAQLRGYLTPQVHLVVNGAYDTGLLLAQVRAFGCLPVEDLIVTHLDEEPRWAKLWNLALGTPFPIRYLSAGQNIPGAFFPATPDQLLDRPITA